MSIFTRLFRHSPASDVPVISDHSSSIIVPKAVSTISLTRQPPQYPDRFTEIMHPRLDTTGPNRYDLSEIDLLEKPSELGWHVRGCIVYDYLKKRNLLSSCLRYQDGCAIQEKGSEVYKKFFGYKILFLWGSVMKDRKGQLYVRSLEPFKNKVGAQWRWLADGVNLSHHYIARFKNFNG